VRCFESAEQFSSRLEIQRPDLLVLDLMLPGEDGLSLLRRLRDARDDLAIVMLTAKGDPVDRIIGLEQGADDYLAKPFEIAELLARLRALERRLGGSKSNDLMIGPVCMDTKSLEVKVSGEALLMSRREYMLLKALMESPNKVQTRDMLDSKLYGWGEEVSSNAVEVHIHNLRKKLPEGFIRTVRGVGYVVKSAT
jgi:DNA-binding response OmpR family regulator